MKHLNLEKLLKKYPIEPGSIIAILSGRGWGKTEKVKEQCLNDFEKGLGQFEWVVNSEEMIKDEKEKFFDGLIRRQKEDGEKFLFNVDDYVIEGTKIYKNIKVKTDKVDDDDNPIFKEERVIAGRLKLLIHLKNKGSRTRTANFVYDEFNDGVPTLHKNFQFRWWWKRVITLTEGEFPPKLWVLGNNENHNTELGIRIGLSKLDNGITYKDGDLFVKDSRDMSELFGGQDSKIVKLSKKFGVYETTFSTEYAGIERYNIVDLKTIDKKFVIGFSSSKDDDSFIVSIYSGYIGQEHIYYCVSEEYREVYNDLNRGANWISKNVIGISQIKGNEDFKVMNKKLKESFKDSFRKLSNEGKMYFRYERCRDFFNNEIFK